MPPEGSTVRFPEALLDRATSLDSERRSEIIREACEYGLDHMEKEILLETAGDLQALIENTLESSDVLDDRIMRIVRKYLSANVKPQEAINVLPFYPMGAHKAAKGFGSTPVFSLKKGESIELIIPPVNWMVYEPIDIRIHTGDPKANVQISKLCSDEGAGRDLFMPGWHSAHEFGGRATALAKSEIIISPKDMRMFVKTDRATTVAISLVIRIREDDAFGGAFGAPLSQPTSNLAASMGPSLGLGPGRRVRVPFVQATPSVNSKIPPSNQAGCLETGCVNWGVLRVVQPVFEVPEATEAEVRKILLNTLCADLKIGGSPTLFGTLGWYTGADFTADRPPTLRAYPILISPNRGYMSVKVHDESLRLAEPYLVCEVIRDDAFNV